jgi:hypothetical protein
MHQDFENRFLMGFMMPNDESIIKGNDMVFSIGKSAYFGFGGGYSFNFNMSEFLRRVRGENRELMQCCE